MSAMAMQPVPKGGVAERSKKPRPLELEGGGASPEPLPLEEVLHLMNNIQTAVKTATLDAHLAGLIFKLYYQLKIQGHHLEQLHKNDMNRVFVSLRQACCRDAGQLGTPCRLKIVELVELRAMGWRPNLAHSQYYLNRQPPTNGNSNTGQHQLIGHNGGHEEPGPVSAPPFGSVPMNPFAFAMPPPPNVSQQHHILSQQHQPHHFTSLADMSMGMGGMGMSMGAGQRPSYYLVPAAAAGPSALFHHFQPASPLPPPQLQPLGPQHFLPSMPPQQMSPRQDSPSDWPKGALIRSSSKFPAPQRVPGKNQFRDEIQIRNADSGKIMGVKGRRVAVVESLTKTVISFQKVASGAKERTLTLTANTEEEIAYAKKLIEETIRRNVSPNRGPDDPGDGSWTGEGLMETSSSSLMESSMEGSFSSGMSSLLEGIRLQCDDPEMLAAAQEALADYFQRGGALRRSQGSVVRSDRELKRERRKSMPSFSPETGVMVGGKRSDADVDWRKPALPFLPPEPKDSARATTESPKTQGLPTALSAAAKSTPDLSVEVPAGGGVGRLGMRVVYTKDYLLKCAGSPLATCSPGNMPYITKEAPEILREVGVSVEVKVPAGGGVGRLGMRVVYTKDYLLKCAGSPLATCSPGNMPYITKEAPEILREVGVSVEVKVPAGGGVGRLGMRVVYTKDYLLKCAGSPLATCSPGNMPYITKEAPEILREVGVSVEVKVPAGGGVGRLGMREVYTKDYLLKCAGSPLATCSPGNMPYITKEAPEILREVGVSVEVKVPAGGGVGRLGMRVVYTKDYLLKCAGSPLATCSPGNMPYITKEAPEILREVGVSVEVKVPAGGGVGRLGMRVVYTKDYLLKCAGSPLATCSPGNMPYITKEAPEILREVGVSVEVKVPAGGGVGRLEMRVVYTKDYLLKCASSPLATCSPGNMPYITKEAPEILREVGVSVEVKVPAGGGVGRLGMRVVYTKDYLLKCAGSPLATCSPGNMPYITKEAPEILREVGVSVEVKVPAGGGVGRLGMRVVYTKDYLLKCAGSPLATCSPGNMPYITKEAPEILREVGVSVEVKVPAGGGVGRLGMRVVYTKDYLLKCAGSPLATCSPGNMPYITKEAPEILREVGVSVEVKVPAGGGVGRLGMRVVYTKDYLLKCAGSPLATCSPGNMPYITKEAPEILREVGVSVEVKVPAGGGVGRLGMRVVYTKDYLLKCAGSPLATCSPGNMPYITKEAPEILREVGVSVEVKVPAGGGVGRLGMRVVYTKDYLLKCAGSPLATCSPGNMPYITKEAPEILREEVGRYSVEEYKLKVAELKTAMATMVLI